MKKVMKQTDTAENWNWDSFWEIVGRLIVILPYLFGLIMAIVWTCLPFWVRSILRQLEALNKAQAETNQLLRQIVNPGGTVHRDSDATRNPFDD